MKRNRESAASPSYGLWKEVDGRQSIRALDITSDLSSRNHHRLAYIHAVAFD